jgi:hypothetical protein
MAPPGVNESRLPPADKTADGIGVFDVGRGKVTGVPQSGSDPEQFDVSKDGKSLFVSQCEELGCPLFGEQRYGCCQL